MSVLTGWMVLLALPVVGRSRGSKDMIERLKASLLSQNWNRARVTRLLVVKSTLNW